MKDAAAAATRSEREQPAGGGTTTAKPRRPPQPPSKPSGHVGRARYERDLELYAAQFPDHDAQQVQASLIALRSRGTSTPTHLEVLKDLTYRYPVTVSA